MASPERIFLAGTRPYSSELAELLLDRHEVETLCGRRADLRDVTVILPGARSGRRLLDHLARKASERGLPWVPPRIQTPGHAIDAMRLARETQTDDTWNSAGPFERRSAWSTAVRRQPARDRERLGIGQESPLAIWALARQLDDLHRELAGEAFSIADAADRLPGRPLAIAARVEEFYHAILETYHRRDPYRQRRLAVHLPPSDSRGPIYLIGLFDLPGLLRRYLATGSEPVIALVCGDVDQEDAFDEFGAAIADRWTEVAIDIPRRAIHFARDAEAQATLLAEQIAAWVKESRDSLAIEDVSIGVVDTASSIAIQRVLADRAVNSRSAAGRPYSLCGPARLLASLRAIASEPNFDAVASLVRHPDVERWWHVSDRSAPEPRLTALDRYRRDHLPSRWAPGPPNTGGLTEPLARLADGLAPILRPGDERRSLSRWSDAIRSVLERFYSARTVDEAHASDRETIEALGLIRNALDEIAELDPKLAPSVTATDALAILNDELSDSALTDPDREPGVELLGWLELLLDDASHLIVTSVNEPGLPAPAAIDPFLPEPARRTLGLNDHARRYARDAAIACALQQRADHAGALSWIATRIDSDGRPALPSRLLLATDADTIARRIQRFSDPRTEASPGDVAPESVEAPRPPTPHRFELPRPLDPPPLERLRVTAFRDYLACPYRFYLRHVLRLESIDDRATELDAAAFGTLIHEVLHRFGEDESIRDSVDPTSITSCLVSVLDAIARERYGAKPLPAVRIQLAGARQRLAAFAEWQAHRRRQGYRIREAELATSRPGVSFAADDLPFFLTGTIDRIDVHEQTGETVLLDYKTSETGRDPDRVHRKRTHEPDPERPDKRRVVQTWVDLQLPLYRHLAAAHGYDTPATLGYIVLPRDLSRVELAAAAWSRAELDEADTVARSVVRSLQAQKFWPPSPRPPAFSELFSPICQDGLLVEGADEAINAVDFESGDDR